MRHVWINAGELSGDIHGQALLQALHRHCPDLEAVGMGGPHMEQAGMRTLLRVESLSVMGLTETFTALPRAIGMLRRIQQELTERRGRGELDAVVLIDAPDFNFRVARMASGLGIPVYYHIPPKVWAWRTGRVRFLRKYTRKIFSILPFEADFYTAHGLGEDRVVFVGNPLVDMVDYPALASVKPLARRIGIMPGSRRAEVSHLMPLFGDTARRLRAGRPDTEYVCLRAPNIDADTLRALWPADVPLTMAEPETRYQTMRSCTLLLAASGTATLEAALAGTPTVLAYKVSPLTYAIGKHVVKVPWVGLPNLILNREVFPECLQDKANPDNLAAIAGDWLDKPDKLDTVRRDLDLIRQLCGPPGSADRAARLLLDDLDDLTARPEI